ncbi:MAG: S26 family signal peptidase [Spirochaetales bacterium]|jgi:signal peptidase I|nr:S26 family signal peptidase [Spirochaetales bacterium]
MEKLLDRLVSLTESYLTWRKIRRRKKKEKQKKKNVIVDWIEAFIWAAFVVLLVNQYVLQAYQIPSGSMMNTLLVDDRIFVNKIVFGPELLPGLAKISGFQQPKRGEVIIFENPSYISRGPLFDIVQRILYMMSLSFVDIDRDELGRPKAHFLIKRAVGMEYDMFRQRGGNLEIKPQGEDRWYPEEEFQKLAGISYSVRRLISPETYSLFRQAGAAAAYHDMRLPLEDPDLTQAVNRFSRRVQSEDGAIDQFAFDQWRAKTLYAMNPHERRYGALWRKYDTGAYIPQGKMLPLGDNRDNSRDGRYFGAVRLDKILGRAMFRYYPLYRIGNIE